MTPRADGQIQATEREVLTVGPLEIRPAELSATVEGRRLELTVREFQLLIALAERADRVVTRSELYAEVWGRPYHPDERSVDVYVRKLRRKLAAVLPGATVIHTHFGFGYRLAAENPPVSHVFHNTATDR
jgi:DNA-binding response OmpR family regulator